MDRTIRELHEATGISISTLTKAHHNGLFGSAARQAGVTRLTNDEHPDYLKWLQAHPDQWRVKRPVKKQQ